MGAFNQASRVIHQEVLGSASFLEVARETTTMTSKLKGIDMMPGRFRDIGAPAGSSP